MKTFDSDLKTGNSKRHEFGPFTPFSFTKNSFRLQEFSFINFRLQNNFRLHFRLRILGFDLDFRLLILDFRLLISYFRLLIFRINFNH